MQSRKHSLMESTTNVVVGYVVAFLSQVAVFPIVGVTASLGQNAQIGAYFTVISLARSYAIRRWFNASVEA